MRTRRFISNFDYLRPICANPTESRQKVQPNAKEPSQVHQPVEPQRSVQDSKSTSSDEVVIKAALGSEPGNS